MPAVAVNVDAADSDTITLTAVLPKYTLFCPARTVPPVTSIDCAPPVCSPEYAKLLPALVIVTADAMLTVDVPVVNAHRKLALTDADAPVCVSDDPAPCTVTEIVPVATATLTFATAAVRMAPVLTVTVAVGAPVK